MNYHERAIANGHTERYADPEEQIRAKFWAQLIYRYGYEPARIGVEIKVPDRTPSDRADYGSVPPPVHGRARTRAVTHLEAAAGRTALRSNDIQPISKEALVGAIKICRQTFWAGGKLWLPAVLSI